MIDFIGDYDEVIQWLETTVGLAANKPVTVSSPPAATANTTIVKPAPVVLVHNVWPTQREVWSTFHNNGTVAWVNANLVDVPCPWLLRMDKITLHSIQIHKSCAESLKRVLGYIWQQCGESQEAIEKLHYDKYSGSYNYRPIRGGTAMSMHSYGLAIDFDAEENEQHSPKHLFTDDSLIIKAFKAEGWVCGVDWSPASIDAMHVQAARVS